jgi:ribosomal protein S2
MLLGQINVVVFSNSDNSAKLLQHARNLNIPTIGLCGEFAQTNLKAKSQNNRQWVDSPIVANPNNHHSVTMIFATLL